MTNSITNVSKLPCILSPIWLGKISYNKGLEIQKDFINKVKNSNNRCYILLQEHNPVYTIGIRNHLYSKNEEERLKSLGAEFHRVGRGGLITFHGPGQIVGYPIIKISSLKVSPDNEYKNYSVGVRRYVHLLEETIIRVCKDDFKIENVSRSVKNPGVWINNEEKKICALGVGFSHGISYHGFALNCNTDLKWFKEIIPCGLEDKEITSLSNELNRNINVMDVLPNLIKQFSKTFEIPSTDKLLYM
uniref:Octanoyl-[acyl-carrier-protein]:protein N-octanoyltransferase LIPT2, mitochondrial n=1 Tax=Parastrongyloides trichosuri TaxID=131310 RepID=A0A0N5A1Y1_PARTI